MAIIIKSDGQPIRPTRLALARMRSKEMKGAIHDNAWLDEWSEFITKRGVNSTDVINAIHDMWPFYCNKNNSVNFSR